MESDAVCGSSGGEGSGKAYLQNRSVIRAQLFRVAKYPELPALGSTTTLTQMKQSLDERGEVS